MVADQAWRSLPGAEAPHDGQMRLAGPVFSRAAAKLAIDHGWMFSKIVTKMHWPLGMFSDRQSLYVEQPERKMAARSRHPRKRFVMVYSNKKGGSEEPPCGYAICLCGTGRSSIGSTLIPRLRRKMHRVCSTPFLRPIRVRMRRIQSFRDHLACASFGL
ncbi:hypothetical protein [Komagataeibacter sp. FNDCF1]|uniref:hypothetical protein n=1 Tax=Komagataeibacter sp. FNDCF1 TaxID=2878681 RepID=UPI001E585864|nr:hypothetical protein [Komagataeibacter sp. FNDCF1]MCE2563409.1 hypothetical protein [Komagataeibacter sp. FNDCF1]